MNTSIERRHVLLEGGCNFRDIGGYPTQDGRRVRWGLVFRSGVMDRLSDADHRKLDALGIGTVIDLRTTRERTRRPTRLPAAWRNGHWARDYDNSAADHSRPAAGLTVEEMRMGMMKAYRRIPFEQAEGYRELFRCIAEGKLPLLFHCLGGKDRTGVGTALLLDMLGVPRDIVLEDYALTDHCLARDSHIVAEADAGAVDAAEEAARVPLTRADPAYLAQMFDKLIKNFGSADAYRETMLGVDAKQRARIVERLLEDA